MGRSSSPAAGQEIKCHEECRKAEEKEDNGRRSSWLGERVLAQRVSFRFLQSLDALI